MSNADRVDNPGAVVPTEEWREVRLALVLYGGVSLAIYMYGVAFEVWRIVRASRALEGGDADPDNPWSAVLEALERRATVDIVSGASAGGINGITLGRALASGANLEKARKVWVEKADFSELLDDDEKKPRSLLDSDFFEKALGKAFKEMDIGRGGRLVDVLDVFVSTTHLSGDLRDFEDSLGQRLETRRHDVPVHLRLRDRSAFATALGAESEDIGESDRNDFDDDELLVQVARATSAFPVAFEPVGRTNAQHGNEEWPKGTYTDGGVSDNKPFEQVIDAIFGRAAELPVSRWVLSVDPDAEAQEPAPDFAPDFLDVVAAATFAIPRYESIQGDLDRLYDHQQRVRAFWAEAFSTGGLEGAIAPGSADVISDDYYSSLRRSALVSLLTEEYRRARRSSGELVNRATEIKDWLRISAQLPAEQSAWEQIDVALSLRRAYYVIKLLGGLDADADQLAKGRQAMWRRFEAARSAAWRAASGLLASGAVPLDLSALGTGVDGSADAQEALHGLGSAATAFRDFERRDRVLLAFDPFRFRMPRDLIDHARINPGAAHELDDVALPADRLAGDTLAHFGGFLDRRWRKNDILWGRLDAADVLVRVLAMGTAGNLKKLTAEVQGQIARQELDLADDADWRNALRASAPAGGEAVTDLSGQRLALLALRAGRILSRMFGTLDFSGRSRGEEWVRRVVGRLGSWMVRALTPLLALVAVATGKGKPSVRLLAAAALVPAMAATLYAALDIAFDNRVDAAIFLGGWVASFLAGRYAKRKILAS